MNRAVFLDRDGVLVEDVGPVSRADQLRLVPGVPESLRRLRAAGFRLFVATNQSVIARGTITEDRLAAIHEALSRLLAETGAPVPDGYCVCPHHPNATLEAYRVICDCRKPAPGLILRAAREHGLDPAASFMVGDRLTDILAGARAGCRTILVHTGRHEDPPIETAEGPLPDITPDHVARDLPAASDWILNQPSRA